MLPAVELTDRFPAIAPFHAARDYTPGERLSRTPPGAELGALREAAPDVRAAITVSGMPTAVATCDLVTLPYPTKFGLWRASTSRNAFIWITNRMLLVQWTDADGTDRTLLWEPSDHERGEFTPYFHGFVTGQVLPTPGLDPATKLLSGKLPPSMLVTEHGTVLGHLRARGIDPADIDYLAFDHLHTQDVRRLVGTTRPATDLGSPDAPIEAWFPNAVLLTQAREWATLDRIHPLQAAWYQPETYTDLPADRIGLIDGDVLLGPGVALLATPGHTAGNQTLAVNTDTGVWISSENGIAADNWRPRASKLRGVRDYVTGWGHEVMLNANTVEFASWQYDSMVAEALVADASPDGDFRQTFPSSELTAHRMSPGTRATVHFGAITHGSVRASRTVVDA